MGKNKKDAKHDAHAGEHHNTDPHALPPGHHNTKPKPKSKPKPKEKKKSTKTKK